MKYRLIHHPHIILYTKAEEVMKQDKDMNELVIAMQEIMRNHRGIGLAANQVGILKRVIIIHAGGYTGHFINPVIEKSYGGKATSKEGCLSCPGMVVSKVRSRQIIVKGFTKDWEPIHRKLKGLAAYCIQHEVDHLNGITIKGVS